MVASTHPDLDILKFVVNIEGREPDVVEVKGNDKIVFKIPENSKYSMTVYFTVANNSLKGLKYKQVIKKGGIPFKTRELEFGADYDPSEEIYSKTFPEDQTPGGYFIRGTYYATSTYYANGEELMAVDWTLEIVKK